MRTTAKLSGWKRSFYRCFMVLMLSHWTIRAVSDGPYHWRLFTLTDGLDDSYTTSVSASPLGHVIVKHGERGAVSKFDGYGVDTLPNAGNGSAKIHESRHGQLWTVHAEGVLSFKRGRWELFQIEAVRNEMQTNLTRQIRPISLVPTERDRILVLLTDRLLDFNAGSGRVTSVLRALDGPIGGFIDMIERKDGSLLISGRDGVAIYDEGFSQIVSEGAPRFLSPPPEFGVRDLHRLLEDSNGGVTMIGELKETGQRGVVRLFENAWRMVGVGAEKVRYAWQSQPEEFWLQSIGRLVRISAGDPIHKIETIEEFTAGQFLDATSSSGGIYWMATSDGLARYSPLAWREPAGVKDGDTTYSMAVEDAAGILWFAGSLGLTRKDSQGWRHFAWPATMEIDFRPGDNLKVLADRRIVFNLVTGVGVFDPRNESFEILDAVVEMTPRRVVGEFREGIVAILASPTNSREWTTLIRWDGTEASRIGTRGELTTAGGDMVFLTGTPDGNWWSGGPGGLYRSSGLAGDKVSRLDGFKSDRVQSLIESGRGKIWCGAGGAIWEYEGFDWRITAAGFERVNSMMKSRDGSVWVAANNGLWRFHKGAWTSIGLEEGLPSSVVYRVLEDRGGGIWALTPSGLRLYYPQADTDPPRSKIEPLDPTREATTDEPYVLRLSGRDKWRMTESSRLYFSWRLDQGPWTTYAGLDSVTLRNLSSGPHQLEVRAMDRNWNEEEQPVLFSFTALMPWYREPRVLVVGFCGLGVAIVLAGIAANRHLRLLRSYAEVERIVAIRTEELERANKELLHSQKMRALGTLAAGVAHDFNSILSIIKGSIQLIESNAVHGEKVKVRIDRIKTVVEQGGGLVRALLGLSRGSAEESIPCDVNRIVQEIQPLMGDRFLRDTTLNVEIISDLPEVLGQPDLIKQILINLLINASEATQEQGMILVRTGIISEVQNELPLRPVGAGPYVFITVSDNGCGIPSDSLSRVFEPFYTTKGFSARRGTGLGLSMVYELCKGMGYGIGIDSIPGKGSNFTLYLVTVSGSELRNYHYDVGGVP